MRRAVQVTFSLLAMLAVTTPLDCFAANVRAPEAMDCCLKAKCGPKANADVCCKSGVPERDLLAPKSTAGHRPALIALFVVGVPSVDPPPDHLGLGECGKHPPPRLELIPTSLPLLI